MPGGKRYSLRWTDGNGRTWHYTYSFNCVADAYAAEHAPDGASRYTITNIADRRYCIERAIGD
jgi:hypothetical protein